MQEETQNKNDLRWKVSWFALVVVVCLAVIVLVHDDYGVSWDGARMADYGDAVLEYFTSGFTSQSYKSCDDAHFYGPSFELLAASIYQYFPDQRFEIRHLLSALAGLLALIGTMGFAALFRGRAVLFFTPIILIMLPRFTGHAFINTKDIPFACGFVWTMFSMALLFRGRKFTWPKILFFGVCLGAALSVRMGGLLAFCFFFPVAGYYLLVRKPWQGLEAGSLRMQGLALGLKMLCAVAVAWLVMVAFWPWAHENPFGHPVEAFKLATQFHRSIRILFMGAQIQSANLPWYYLPWYLMITTPPLVLVLLALGTGSCVRGIYKTPRSEESLLSICLLFWFWFPLAYVVLTHPNIYDGIRHFLFILPGMALLGAVGVRQSADIFRGKAKTYLLAGLAGALLLPLVDMVGLHPYQMTYFNSIVGKVGGAQGKYDTDYWLTSYKECMEWLNQNTDPANGPIKVLVVLEPLAVDCAKYFAAPHIRIVLADRRPAEETMPDFLDYLISSTRFGNHMCFPGSPVVFVAERDGAVFSLIRSRE
ncbi:MAG: hypothetical protein JEZ02_11020 [Desulfatibacillum sp.]|nr:hypothetical protein [Desulfatibacillum sp.]